MPAFSQGSTVQFNGVAIGSLLSWEVTPASASTTDATSADSTILGVGAQARVVKQVDCTAIDPGTASITLLGGEFVAADIGMTATLEIDCELGVVSVEAIFADWTWSASVGELIKGSARFILTGDY